MLCQHAHAPGEPAGGIILKEPEGAAMRRCEVFWEGGVWVAEKRRRDFALALAGVAGAGCTFALRVGPTTPPCVAIAATGRYSQML